MPFTPLQDGEKDVSIQLSSLWSLHSPKGLYKDTQAIRGNAQIPRHPDGNLHGRHVIDGKLQAEAFGARPGLDVPPRELGVHYQQQEIYSASIPRNRIPRNDGELSVNGPEIARGEDQKDQIGSPPTAIHKTAISPITLPAPWEFKCDYPNPANGPHILSFTTNLSEASPIRQPAKLPDCSPAIHPGTGRSSVVGTPPHLLEWEKPDHPGIINDNNIRCLPTGLGCNLQRCSDQWSMVPSRTIPPHQLPRAVSCHTCSPDIRKGEVRHLNSPAAGQFHGCRLYQQKGGGGGGDSVTNAVTTYKGPVAVVHEEEHPPSSSAPTRSSECDRGQGVQIMVRQVRVDAVSNLIPENQPATGTTVHRPVCKQAIITAPSVCELETRPSSSGHRCVYSGLELTSRETVCQSTLGPDRQSPVTCILPRSSRAGTSSTSLESPSMVPNAPPNAGQSASSYTTVNRHNTASVSEHSTRHHPTASHVGYICQQCESSHLSQSAMDLVLSSWRDKSTKSYNSSFGKWACWCGERNRNPISGPISDVANFLAELYKQGYQYSSLNSYRSAISSTHEKVDGQPVGQHPTIVRVLKGAYNKRPPLPKYTSTWEVSKVTSYIVALGDNDSLSLKSLSLKLVVLLALTRPSRSNDLSNLSLKAMRVLPDGIQFNPVCLSKQSRPSRPLKPFTFPSFFSDKRLCPKEAVQAYVARTESFRGEGKEKLLLSFIKPHNPISSSSVARWIVTLLKLAGVDTDTFKSHSVRSASATAAASAGITTNQIMEAADWRLESVFERFYYKPGNSNQVGQAVLSTSSTDSLQTSR